jgi:hypothetical protein
MSRLITFSKFAMAAVALGCALLGIAQAPDGTPSPPAKSPVLLREGTEVSLKLAQDVNSRAAKPNEPIELALAENLKVGDIIVAKAGSRALGTVVHAKKPDFWGEAGEVNIRITFLKVGATKVPLRGAAGEVGTRYIVIRGSQAILRTGTLLKAYVAEDTLVTVE